MGRIDIEITPKLDALVLLNASQADFDGALESALDRLVGTPTNQLPPPRDIAIVLHGEEYHLGDLARIDVTFGPAQAALSI